MAEELQSQAMEIKQRFGDERAVLLRQMFDVPLEAARVAADTVGRTIRNTVSKDAKQSVFMAEGEAAARALRGDAKVKYVQSELEEQAALIALQEHLEEFLAPEEVTASDVAATSALSEEHLISAADAVAPMPGEKSENVLKVFLAVARQKGYEQAVHHIVGFRDEWQMALTDISICEESSEKTEEDIASEFSSFAKDDPDGPAILAAAARSDDLNLMHMLR